MAAEERVGIALPVRTRAEGTSRLWKSVTRFITGKPLGAVGAGIIIVMVLVAILQPVITFHDAEAWSYSEFLDAPSLTHWLGTDDKGRDMWTRMVVGARVSLLVGFASVAFGSGLGGVLGIISAWFGGKVDQITQRLMDALMAIP